MNHKLLRRFTLIRSLVIYLIIMDYQEIIDGINEVMNREIPMLLSLTEEQVSVRRNSQNRTVKMLAGHLIDSASNNHQRMVRLQYAPRCGHSMPNS